MRTLDLSDNPISEIPEKAFLMNKRLKHLMLANTNITVSVRSGGCSTPSFFDLESGASHGSAYAAIANTIWQPLDER